MKRVLAAGAAALVAALCNCGSNPVPSGEVGGGGTGGTLSATDPNTVQIVVDPGPTGTSYTNGLFATVTLCEPGTSNCQTFDHLLVDTGSVGVRVLESELRLSLPAVTSAAGVPLAECTPFVDGTAWGPVRRADVVVSGESAPNIPVQVIGEQTFAMPSKCTGLPITNFETLSANGIFGVGTSTEDCGSACALDVTFQYYPPYYMCTSAAACSAVAVPLANQVAHPVAAFPLDNNGTIIQLPNIPVSGSPTVAGVMTFGIGTQANNGLGGAAVLGIDGRGYVSTIFPTSSTATYSSYIDSGSNALFFLDSATTKLSQCTGGLSSFYCPAGTASLSAVISANSGGRTTVSFNVANASRLSRSAFAFANLAGPMPGFPTIDGSIPAFDWGLPFYFGRSVYTAIEGKDTPGGVGPFFAF